MVSPQEVGVIKEEVTITLAGTEIGAVIGWLDAFPQTAPCLTNEEGCDGVRVLTPDEGGFYCQGCAELTNTGLTLSNVREEIKRKWQTVMLSSAE